MRPHSQQLHTLTLTVRTNLGDEKADHLPSCLLNHLLDTDPAHKT
jgi:hypothetical protein